MFCIYCGNKVEATEESCSSCGNVIYKETPVKTPTFTEILKEPPMETPRFPETSNEAFPEIEMQKIEETMEEFRVISGSEAMLRRIPLKSPRES
jgi:hypothetical protein